MKLYLTECRRIAKEIVYYLFVVILIVSWFQNFRGITESEIDWANGISSSETTFDRPLLSEPSPEDDYFGNKVSEDDTEAIMTGVTKALIAEYEDNSYATYPIGYYKAVSLSDEEQERVLEIICEITGLSEEQLETLPDDYFPAITGTMISVDEMTVDADGNYIADMGNSEDTDSEEDKTQHFSAQVTYEHFKELMQEMEEIIGEKGSKYSTEMMITYFGLSEMTYEEAYEEYTQTIEQDKVTGGFARLFCDYMGLILGFYPVFIVVIMWMHDRRYSAEELLYNKKISSIHLVLSRYLASVTMVILPVLLLSFESLFPLIGFGAENGLSIDYFAYLKYICWWLLPTIMTVCALGMFFTILTDTPIAILVQFCWWMVDKGTTGLSGDTHLTTLMIRHNTLRGYEIIQNNLEDICMNRLLMAGISILLVILSAYLLNQKRKGILNAGKMYRKCLGYMQDKFSLKHTK